MSMRRVNIGSSSQTGRLAGRSLVALLSRELLAAGVQAVGLGVVLLCHLPRFGMLKSLCGKR